jgi:hypothetical protein
MTNNEIDAIATKILKEVLMEAQDKWLEPESKYKEYRSLQIDKRGSFGERFFSQVLSQIYYRRLKIEYKDGDQGDWDLKFNGVKFEIKTASIDVNNKFQNEGIKKDGDYDGVLFLGVTPNSLYIKFTLKQDIPFHVLHNREERKTGRGYKWDFKLQEMIKVKSLQDIQNEFDKHFSFLFKGK